MTDPLKILNEFNQCPLNVEHLEIDGYWMKRIGVLCYRAADAENALEATAKERDELKAHLESAYDVIRLLEMSELIDIAERGGFELQIKLVPSEKKARKP